MQTHPHTHTPVIDLRNQCECLFFLYTPTGYYFLLLPIDIQHTAVLFWDKPVYSSNSKCFVPKNGTAVRKGSLNPSSSSPVMNISPGLYVLELYCGHALLHRDQRYPLEASI